MFSPSDFEALAKLLAPPEDDRVGVAGIYGVWGGETITTALPRSDPCLRLLLGEARAVRASATHYPDSACWAPATEQEKPLEKRSCAAAGCTPAAIGAPDLLPVKVPAPRGVKGALHWLVPMRARQSDGRACSQALARLPLADRPRPLPNPACRRPPRVYAQAGAGRRDGRSDSSCRGGRGRRGRC
jgi:hypothetical protein